MKLVKRDDYLELDKPIGEVDEVNSYVEDKYIIQRSINDNGTVVWYGLKTNWKLKDGVWSKLIYDELNESHIWFRCEKPIYETLYNDIRNENS